MKAEGSMFICTVDELARKVANEYNKPNWKGYDFSDNFMDSDSVAESYRTASGWYGIKKVDTGFDVDSATLVCDYYGGGSPSVLDVCHGDENIVDNITAMISKTLNGSENVTVTLVCEEL